MTDSHASTPRGGGICGSFGPCDRWRPDAQKCSASGQRTEVLASLLIALGREGIELAPHPTDPARLRHRRMTPVGWAADLPTDLGERLRMHKAAVLGLLAPCGLGGIEAHPEAGYVLGERLGVADRLGLATHSGSPAWLVAVGEAMGCEP